MDIMNVFFFLARVALICSFLAEPHVSHRKISLAQNLDPDLEDVHDLIVDIHNYYRARVDPPAANMLEMVREQAGFTLETS
jgi:hypothetical protein